MKTGKAEDGEVRTEYDFSKAVKNPYAERANRKTNLVVIEPELFEVFGSSEAVNDAFAAAYGSGCEGQEKGKLAAALGLGHVADSSRQAISVYGERTVYYELESNEFEWDEEIARINLEKHGITFQEAARAFEDQLQWFQLTKNTLRTKFALGCWAGQTIVACSL